ncbi:hypothetical protein Cs7R123_33330 [Catellatospora sp. TT07R-123]|uniref:LppU/SCO3897 family protein n=1 Tax=Catellatospora sp. TT07R-123 TaxID=2733863 RepID=UPI001B1E6CC6|nr:hypothetical protein [Catellatospora sp. TT07R-123]GHJ45991.1 hypothetical protein Cs7R123_33330 [Catellatospora sp. TT07R-123]
MSEQENPTQQPPAYEPPAAGAESPVPAAPVAAEEPKKSSKLLSILGVIVVIVIIGVVKFGAAWGLGSLWDNITGAVQTADVGDCINEYGNNVDDAKVVDCADPKAANKVVGIVEDKYTSASFQIEDNPCTAYPDAEKAIWVGDTGTGDVWCLVSTTK